MSKFGTKQTPELIFLMTHVYFFFFKQKYNLIGRPSYIQVTPPCAFLDFGCMCVFQQRSNDLVKLTYTFSLVSIGNNNSKKEWVTYNLKKNVLRNIFNSFLYEDNLTCLPLKDSKIEYFLFSISGASFIRLKK
ncbi:hypothetical protein BpHYR1_024643 [Brachionus plicatilis]|uniref:Uncharacterized protein n=1 Tax=Brachionus plicatilis TaxID=10195 RepID=A0A3M7SH06_BRAPC|nr:hypothetical protein BpHYR1_024643 [Brachionus plicatilis]